MKRFHQHHLKMKFLTIAIGAAQIALTSVASAQNNTKIGRKAGASLTTGTNNTATGTSALQADKTGSFNTAVGASALMKTTGASNVAVGFQALWKNTAGGFNVAIGDGALWSNSTGSRNIGLGEDAGINLTVGNDNICIDNPGMAGESGIIRIGTAGAHTSTYLSGVIHGDGSQLTGLPVGLQGIQGVAGPAGPQGPAGTMGPQGPAGTAISSGNVGGVPTGMKEFLATGNFTVPAGITRIMVEAWGAGGGGGAGFLLPGVGDHDGQGGSGGGGGYSRTIVPVIPGRTYLVTVGVGGSPEAQGGNTEFSDGPVLSATPLVRSTGGQPGSAITGADIYGAHGDSGVGDPSAMIRRNNTHYYTEQEGTIRPPGYDIGRGGFGGYDEHQGYDEQGEERAAILIPASSGGPGFMFLTW